MLCRAFCVESEVISTTTKDSGEKKISTTARDDGRSDTGAGRGDRRAKDDRLGVQRGKKSIVQGSSHEYANLMMRP